MPDTTHYKLLIMFIIDKVEIPLDEEALATACCRDNDWISYMEFKHVFRQLISAGFIYKCEYKRESNSEHYAITPDGRLCLAHFYSRLPMSLRNEISKYIQEHLANIKREQEYVADYRLNNDGTYTVTLMIHDGPTTIVDLKLRVDTKERAKWLYKNWKNCAGNVYEFLHTNLLDN